MTPINDPLPTLDDRLLDRLVDGELTEPERRALLLQLEREADGWRRCALAFLEAQCWREEFRGLGQRRPAPSPRPEIAPAWCTPAARGRPWLRRLRTVLAMSASFLLALGLGFLLRSAWQGGMPSAPSRSEVAVQEPPKPAGEPALDVPASVPSRSAWQTVSVPVHQGQPLQWPAVERESIDEEWLGRLPPAIPEEMLQALHQSGHRVEVERQLMPLQLRDGRQLVVPVDQMDIHYVGNSAYQ